MNRKSFFRTLGLGAVAAIVAPKVLAEDIAGAPYGMSADVEINFPRGGITVEDLIEGWRKSGHLIYEPRRYMSGTDWNKTLNE